MPGPINNQRPTIQAFLQANQDKTLEVVNVSSNPEAVTANADGMEVKANSWEQFSDKMPDLQEGDVLRVRSRGSNGNVSNWITLQTTGLEEKDTRNAEVFSDAIGMEVNKNGTVDLVYLGDGMVSEPDAQIRLKNEISGEVFDYTTDENGQLPSNLALKGEAGDIFSIAVSDGVNNVDFSETTGLIEVEGTPRIDLADPALLSKNIGPDGKPKFQKVQFSGPLFIDGASIEDVKQGSIANCYFASAVAAVAHSNPEQLQEMIKDNEDGTYTVTFKERDKYNRLRTKEVKVDGDLYVKYGDKPLYGNSNGPEKGAEKMELWFPLLEKAYSALHGNSYEEVGNGGNPGDVMTALLGTHNLYRTTKNGTPDRIFETLKRAQAKGAPITATTYGEDEAEADRYPGSRLYPWHVYSVMGVEEKDGKKFVQVRNPWGSVEPGYDGKDDGIFLLDIDKFAYYFKGVNVGN